MFTRNYLFYMKTLISMVLVLLSQIGLSANRFWVGGATPNWNSSSNWSSTKEEAALSVFEWIETWYNRHRRHSALEYLTIEEINDMMQIQNAA